MSSLDDLLNFDPLAMAEKLTGESYKEDSETMRLGFGLSVNHNRVKEQALRENADSFFGQDFSAALLLFADLGFQEVYREAFSGTCCRDEYVILWHQDGLLATCESYAGIRRNTAKVYYNYRHHTGGYPHGLTSSGHMTGNVWVGDHDAREGIRHNLNRMRSEGEFVTPWVERPFLWLCNYAEQSGKYKSINARKIAALPEAVRDAIGGDGA